MSKVRKGLLLAACAAVATTMTVAATTSAATKPKVGIAYFGPIQNSFTAQVENGIKAAAKKDGAATVKAFIANYDPQAQLRQCQDAIVSKKYKLFVIYAVAPGAILPCVKSAMKANILVVGVLTELSPQAANVKAGSLPKGVVAQSYTLSYDDARQTLNALKLACKGKDPCEIGWLSAMRADSYSAGRLKETERLIKSSPKYSAYKIVAQGESGGFANTDGSRKAVVDMLQAHPEIDVVTADDDNGAVGAYLAGKQLGKTGIRYLGFGSSKLVASYIKDGRVFSSNVNTPFSYGKWGGEQGLKAARGSKTRNIFINQLKLQGLDILTKENVGKFKPEW